MAAKKGIEASKRLRERGEDQRGGKDKRELAFDQSQTDSFGLWLAPHLQMLAVRNYSKRSIDGRADGLQRFFLWCAERDLTRASQITRPILESYQRHLWQYRTKQNKPLGISTQRDRLGALRHFFSWLVRQNVLLSNPASELEMPRAEKRLPVEALSNTQVEALMNVPNISDALGIRDRTILELFYCTGIRRAELARLELADLNTERRTLRVRQGKGHKDRVLPLGSRALHWLRRYLDETRPRLVIHAATQALFLTSYGEAFNPDVLSRQVAAQMKKIGLGRNGSCHLLRHTCATHMLEGGADIRFIQQLLGHEKLDTTAIYTEVSITQLQLVHERCHPAAALAMPTTAKEPQQAASL
jgi:integrase/recombinase XerD